MELCTLYVRGEKGGREMAYLAQQGTGPEEDCNCEGGKGRPAAIDRHHPGPGRGNRERAGGTGSGPGRGGVKPLFGMRALVVQYSAHNMGGVRRRRQRS